MQASIKIYSHFNQSKVINSVTKEREKFMTEKVNETLTYSVNPKLNKAKQLQAVTSFVSQAIGARYKAVLMAGKKLPSKLYFEITLNGEVYRSETALLKANFVSLCTVSLAQLKKLPLNEVIHNVAGTQTNALRISIVYLKDLADIAASVDKETLNDEDFSGSMEVKKSGELVTA